MKALMKKMVCNRYADKLAETNGQFVIDHALVFIIAIIAAIAVIAVFGPYITSSLFPMLQNKLSGLFN